MTDPANRSVPAGWYDDPASPAHVRWWDGSGWTAHIAAKPTAAPAETPQVAHPAAAPQVAPAPQAAEPTSPFGGSTAVDSVPGIPAGQQEYIPAADRAAAQPDLGIADADSVGDTPPLHPDDVAGPFPGIEIPPTPGSPAFEAARVDPNVAALAAGLGAAGLGGTTVLGGPGSPAIPGAPASSGYPGTPAPPSDTASLIAEARELERQYGISTAEHAIIVRAAQQGSAAGGYTPLEESVDAAPPLTGRAARAARAEARAAARASRRTVADGVVPGIDGDPGTREHTGTAAAWLIALWPLWTLIAAAGAGYLYLYLLPEPALLALAALPLLLVIGWAFGDASRLKARGLRGASPALALLGPLIYLIARRARVRGSGPLVTLLLLTVALVGGGAAAVLTGVAAAPLTALAVQQTVRDDLVGSGQLASVACPVRLDAATPGALYTCRGTASDGAEQLVWVSIGPASATAEGSGNEAAAGGGMGSFLGREFSYALALR